MMSSWWWLWMLLMFFMVITPIGYGWGYRGWGPPYPSYVQRRRHLKGGGTGAGSFDYYSWGWGGDLMWLLFLVGIVWLPLAFW